MPRAMDTRDCQASPRSPPFLRASESRLNCTCGRRRPPIPNKPKPHTPNRPEPLYGPALARMSILVVDDIPLNRMVLRATFTGAGATSIAEAADGAQAYELFCTCGGSATFPLIIMDLSMPVCDGWTAASHIRALERASGWPPCRIVACSSEDLSPGSPALLRCWDVGMDAAVGKAVSRGLAAQLLQQYGCPPSAFEAPACRFDRSSEEGPPCCSADLQRQPSPAPSEGTAVSCATAAPDRSMSAPTSSRSSMDGDSGCLPDDLHFTLPSSFCRCASS